MHDPDRTIAIVCGASAWPRLDRFRSAKAFRRTADGLLGYLRDSDGPGLGLAEDNILDLFDSEDTAVEHFDEIKGFLERHMRRTGCAHGKGLLVLVAYIGHGAFFEHFYCLLVRDTHEPASLETSLRVAVLARTLKSTAPKSARVVILDSCFAAHAAKDFQSPVEQIAAREVIEQEIALDTPAEPAREDDAPVAEGIGAGGVALLCAASSRDPAQLASSESYTLFGQALLGVLRDGDQGLAGSMSLRQVWKLVADRLRVRDAPRPEVHSPVQNGHDLANTPLFPNPALTDRQQPVKPKYPARAKGLVGTALGLVAVLVAAAGIFWYIDHRNTLSAHCGTENTTLKRASDECVGLTDGSFDLFQPPDGDAAVHAHIRQVLDTIDSQNEHAEQLRGQTTRPYVTLVSLQALTAPEGATAAALTAERESLQGLAVAQRLQLDSTDPGEPIVRILVGNTGRGTREGPLLARMVVDAVARDRSIVGVVGFNMSNQSTEDTVAELNDARIPTVATTLSYDYLADLIPRFVQVAPQNRNEAATAAGFAANLTPQPNRKVRIYYSGDPEDLYSKNLRFDAGHWFGQFGFAEVDAKAYRPSGQATKEMQPQPGDTVIGDAADAGADTCTLDGIAFFAGRGVPDFGDFLAEAARCDNQRRIVIGGDDVTKHVADPRARAVTTNLPYYYMSFAPAPVTDPEPGATQIFYNNLRNLFAFEREPGEDRSLDGHAALSYDAAQVYITAVRQVQSRAPGSVTVDSVSRQLSKIGTVQGVTGTFNYGVEPRPNVPKRKPVTVLRVENGAVVPRIQAYCGDHHERLVPPAPWCPPNADYEPAPPR